MVWIVEVQAVLHTGVLWGLEIRGKRGYTLTYGSELQNREMGKLLKE